MHRTPRIKNMDQQCEIGREVIVSAAAFYYVPPPISAGLWSQTVRWLTAAKFDVFFFFVIDQPKVSHHITSKKKANIPKAPKYSSTLFYYIILYYMFYAHTPTFLLHFLDAIVRLLGDAPRLLSHTFDFLSGPRNHQLALRGKWGRSRPTTALHARETGLITS